MKKNKSEEYKISSIIRAFQVFSMIIFALLIGFLLLNICTSRKKLQILLKDYVTNVAINEDYYGNYIEYGFTKEDSEELIKGKALTNLVTNVLNDRIVSLCHNTSKFIYSEENCKEEIKKEIKKIGDKRGLDITDDVIDSLTQYTMDITGITNMFKYKTPEEYREKVYEGTENVTEDIDKGAIFKTIATLTSAMFPVCLLLMYIICLVIIVIVCEKNVRFKLYQILCDTALYPSFIAFGFSIGQLISKSENILKEYIFKSLLYISIAGILLAITIGVFTYLIQEKIKIRSEKYGNN